MKKQCDLTPALLKQLTHTAHQSRRSIVEMFTAANSSHMGCSLSLIDILTILYHCFLDVEKIKTFHHDRDIFILSKGHAAGGLYTALAHAGIIPLDLLKNFYKDGGPLSGHPMRHALPGIEASTGSLGHGLPLGVGIALAARHGNSSRHVYVLVGDGECQEGSVWEAITMASRYNLNNLTVIVDYNNLQGLDRSDDIMPGTLAEKFAAFHCHVHEIDGHNFHDIVTALNQRSATIHPQVIVARTTKGKGISFIEDKLEWHYRSFKPDLYAQALQELESS